MKKMIFSATALTAFSFAGMANEVKEREVESKTLIQYENILKKDCIALAKAVLAMAPFFGYDELDALILAQDVGTSCESNQD